MNQRDPHHLLENAGRRRFLAAGSVTVSFSLVPGALLAATKQAATESAQPIGTDAAAASRPGNLKGTPMLDAWIRIDEQGRITVFTGKVELGTGIKTGFIQIAAEELAVKPEAITMITADTERTPNEGYTAGSHSTSDSGTAILHAAAQVRALLVAEAATKLGVDAATLKVADGFISAPDGRKMSYGEAVSGVNLHQEAQSSSPLTDPKNYKVIGQPMRRVDIPGKVTGAASYVQDLRLPGMAHGRVVRPPSYGAKQLKVDSAAVEKMPGVIKVVRDGNYLAVVAEDEWQAIVAMRALAAAAAWEETAVLPAPDKVYDTLLKLPAQEVHSGQRTGAAAPAARTLQARFTKPYLAHASIGPSCAVAHLDQDKMTVWTHAQGVYPLRGGLAELLSMPADRIHCIHVEGSGCYGHNSADDVAADAVLMARAVPGRPVRVQLMREQEFTWEPFGPAMVTEVKAALDENNTVVDWQYEIWSNSHNQRIENAGRLMPAQHLATPFTPAPPKPIPMPEGGADRNSLPLYNFANFNVQLHFLPDMPIRQSAHRGLGAFMNVFSIETFMDELAHAAGVDPVEFRLKHLDDPRARDVIQLTAEKFGWGPKRPRQRNKGVGFAFAKYKNLMTYLAMAVEITLTPETGGIRIDRVVAAGDCGQIVNPDGVRNQLEGGILQAASWALFEEVRHDERRIRSFDWSTYPIMRFSEVPRNVEVHLINRPGERFLGTGEATQGPTPAALGNAIFDATGRRLRSLPLAAGGRLREFRST